MKLVSSQFIEFLFTVIEASETNAALACQTSAHQYSDRAIVKFAEGIPYQIEYRGNCGVWLVPKEKGFQDLFQLVLFMHKHPPVKHTSA